MKLLDTCFLIDLQREFRADKEGPARAFLRHHAKETFAISVVCMAEFLEGFEDPHSGEALLRPFRWIDVGPATARQAARLRRVMRQEGTLIGDFDILIAATALAEGMQLVTSDDGHFARIEGLEIDSYR